MMSIDDLKSKLLVQMTGEKFLSLQQSILPGERTRPTTPPDFTPSPRQVYGLKGIAQLFGCSVSTANRIKNSGVLNKAVKQIGRKIIVDAEYALDLINRKNKGRR